MNKIIDEYTDLPISNNKRWGLRHLKNPIIKKQRNDNSNQCNRKRYEKTKQEIFDLLGNKCSNPNCLVPNGCTDVRCLQIDHVHGGGRQEVIKIMKKGCAITYYKMILEKIKLGSKDYQLLCANCNWIKRFEGKE